MTLNFFMSPNTQRSPSYKISEKYNHTTNQNSPGPGQYQRLSQFGSTAKTSRLQKHRLTTSDKTEQPIDFSISKIKQKENLPGPGAYSPNFKSVDQHLAPKKSIYTKIYQRSHYIQQPGPGYYNPNIRMDSPSFSMRFKASSTQIDQYNNPSPAHYQKLPSITESTQKTKKTFK